VWRTATATPRGRLAPPERAPAPTPKASPDRCGDEQDQISSPPDARPDLPRGTPRRVHRRDDVPREPWSDGLGGRLYQGWEGRAHRVRRALSGDEQPGGAACGYLGPGARDTRGPFDRLGLPLRHQPRHGSLEWLGQPRPLGALRAGARAATPTWSADDLPARARAWHRPVQPLGRHPGALCRCRGGGVRP